MSLAECPVILSHSNPKTLKDHPRNVSDRVIRECAATGGVVGINGIGIFLGDNDISTETFVRHVDYSVQVVGSQHVGISLDYVFDREELAEYLGKMGSTFPAEAGYRAGLDFIEPERLESIVNRLSRLGYREDDLTAILGGNFLRVAREVWK